jgi:hypothetical protein
MEEGREEHMRIHKNTQGLEWFMSSKHNTLHPLFLYCTSKILEYRA